MVVNGVSSVAYEVQGELGFQFCFDFCPYFRLIAITGIGSILKIVDVSPIGKGAWLNGRV